jgi:hypothetical protein
MRYLTLLGLCALSLVFAQLHGPSGPRRHHDIAKRAKGDIQLHRRFTSARWTFYDVGLCVSFNPVSDYTLMEFVGVLVGNGTKRLTL